MSVFALGLNHTTAPLDLRGRFAFSPQQLPVALQAFRSRYQRDSEVAIVSTCNRTELYVGADVAAVDPAVEWLAGVGWLRLGAWPSAAMAAVSLLGLVVFEHDGKMATYGAMVVACAAALWWVGFRSGR